jgi:hypothetical protein
MDSPGKIKPAAPPFAKEEVKKFTDSVSGFYPLPYAISALEFSHQKGYILIKLKPTYGRKNSCKEDPIYSVLFFLWDGF